MYTDEKDGIGSVYLCLSVAKISRGIGFAGQFEVK